MVIQKDYLHPLQSSISNLFSIALVIILQITHSLNKVFCGIYFVRPIALGYKKTQKSRHPQQVGPTYSKTALSIITYIINE